MSTKKSAVSNKAKAAPTNVWIQSTDGLSSQLPQAAAAMTDEDDDKPLVAAAKRKQLSAQNKDKKAEKADKKQRS